MRRHCAVASRLGLAAAGLLLTVGIGSAHGAVSIVDASTVDRLEANRTGVVEAQVPPGQYCRLTLTNARHPVGRSPIRRAAGPVVNYRFRVAPRVAAGTWLARVRCAPTARAVARGSGSSDTTRLRTTVRRPGRPDGAVRGAIAVRHITPLAVQLPSDGKGSGARWADPGWAPEGDPRNARSQVVADERHATAECAPNTVLLFRVRGSGEQEGTDKLGGWAHQAGEDLRANGWRVRDMQAIYDAPRVPVTTVLARLGLRDLWGAANAAKSYRDVATNQWRQVHDQLVAAHNRCTPRRILVSGYSQGGIVLRYVIPNLNRAVRDRIARVDLVADPTADAKVDGGMDTGNTRGLPIRPGVSGVDTAAGNSLWLQRFRQTPHPSDIRGRMTHFCLPHDFVCETNVVNLPNVRGPLHSSYDFRGVGARSAALLGRALTRPAPVLPRRDPPTAPPTTPQTPGASPTPPPDPTPPPPNPTPPVTSTQQQGSNGANTFANPHAASGLGPPIAAMQLVEVSCKVFAPSIASASPDGYWYRIASPPWNNDYYAVANTFWNGDVPGQRPYRHHVDHAVPNC